MLFFGFFVFPLKRLLVFALLLNFFSTTTTHTCEIHSQSDRRKKKKERRVSVVVSVSVVLSLEERCVCFSRLCRRFVSIDR